MAKMSNKLVQLLVMSLLVLQVVAEDCQGFQEYILNFKKEYKDESEKEFRREVFCKNLKELEELQEKYPDAQFGINKFTDRTSQEMSLNGLKEPPIRVETQQPPASSKVGSSTYKNWVEQGAVTSVKDQGSCGSCTAFATAACGQSHLIVNGTQTNTSIDLSEQYILDCAGGSCDGYYMEYTMAYILKGQPPDSWFPYTATSDPNADYCNWDSYFNGLGDAINVATYNYNYYGLN